MDESQLYIVALDNNTVNKQIKNKHIKIAHPTNVHTIVQNRQTFPQQTMSTVERKKKLLWKMDIYRQSYKSNWVSEWTSVSSAIAFKCKYIQ